LAKFGNVPGKQLRRCLHCDPFGFQSFTFLPKILQWRAPRSPRKFISKRISRCLEAWSAPLWGKA